MRILLLLIIENIALKSSNAYASEDDPARDKHANGVAEREASRVTLPKIILKVLAMLSMIACVACVVVYFK